MARCPQCNQALALDQVWGLVTLDRLGCPDRAIGITCPACLAPLRVATARSAAAVVGSYLASAAFAVANARQSAAYPLLALLGIAPFLLVFVYTTRIARRFAVLVPLKNPDAVEFPVEIFEQELAIEAHEDPSAVDGGKHSPDGPASR
jgi:hypothetical protein